VSSQIHSIILIVISLACFVPAIVIHEVAHGFVAHRLGDPTAKSQGRITLNPLKHIDPFGTVILPIILAITGMPVFGYAKPVPYNPSYFKNLKVGEVLTGLAGPASNLIMALIGAIATFIAMQAFSTVSETSYWVLTALYYFVYINLLLMFFNLLPIPPLDGSSIIVPFLPDSALGTWYQIQRYALPILFIVIFIIPRLFSYLGMPGVDPLGMYLDFTAGNVLRLLMPF
jgi:Zn-dependent protease